MGQEQLKVLEMVASGKITPQDGERLINALNGGSYRGRPGNGFGVPEIQVPNIDVGKLAQMAVELKKTVIEKARDAQGRIKRSKASKYFEAKDYQVSVDQLGAADGAVSLDIGVQAGQLKVLGDMDEAGRLIIGRATCVPDAPVVQSEAQEGGGQKVSFRHSLGSCWLRLADTPTYSIKLDNAAADTRLDLSTLKAPSLKINNNAGNLDLRLGDRSPQVEIEVVNNAGSVDLAVDGGFALKVHSSGSLSSSNIENLGLALVDGSYVSPDWEENARRVEILLAQNVASFSISWRGARRAEKKVSVEIEDLSLRDRTEPQPDLDDADRLANEAADAVAEVQAAIADLGRKAPATGGTEKPAPIPQPVSKDSGDLPSSDL